MELDELKNKSVQELEEILAGLRDDDRVLRFKALGGQLKQVHKAKEIQRTAAQIKALLHSKKNQKSN